MRHRDARHRLTQKPAHARMLKRNLVTSLLLYESVRTTRNRAKAVQPIVDRLVVIAKKKQPHQAIRAINRVITDKNASRKLMEVLRDRYNGRSSGFTRIVPAGARTGDGARLVDMELIGAQKRADTQQKVSTVKQKEAVPTKQAPSGAKKTATKKATPSSKAST